MGIESAYIYNLLIDLRLNRYKYGYKYIVFVTGSYTKKLFENEAMRRQNEACEGEHLRVHRST
jgi:hypothetical protein